MFKVWQFCLESLMSIKLDFGIGDRNRQLTLTFNLLLGIATATLFLIGLWAIAAGFLQSARLVPYIPHLYTATRCGFPTRQARWNVDGPSKMRRRNVDAALQ
jgi:hypothetical protein